MAEITFDGLNENSLIMQWNTDNYGNPKSIHINNEIQQISPTHNVIQLAQVPDEYYRVKFIAEGIDGWLLEVRNLRELENINQFYVDYNHGIVYFHEEMAGRLVRADYYGRGVMFLSDARIFHKSGDSFATTLDEVLEKSKDAFKLLESTGGLNEAIELLDQKAQEGTDVADRLEDFITETEFYGYTIILSREAFVVRAKEDGNLHDGELEDLTADVVVYKGAKSLTTPDLNIRIYSTTNCECEIDEQTIKITRIDVNAIKGQAIIEIDCGDGLIAYRTIEVTKVFDGVSQFNVEVTNSFYSFNATHSGKVEEEQSVTCEFNVTKANELYTDYVVGVQNMPTGMTCNLTQPTKGATSVTFTVLTGSTLPDNGSISLVFQMNDNTVITKTFVFSKAKQGLSAKSLMLAGNQIIHYENADYSGTPTPLRTSIVAQVTDLSGTPVWSYLEGEQWIVIDGQNGTSLNLYHNDRIWTDKHELTIKCELDGFSDEITLIKIANGAMGLSSYSVILSNESTTLRVSIDGTIPTEELTSQYTRITAFKGSEQITPTKITVPTSDVYEVSVSGATINLIDVDTSTTTVNIPIEIILDNAVKIDKNWSISKTEPGEHGAPGAVYSMNIEGGTRAITYNQLNENPRPTFSGMFTATVYENGNDITSRIASWYWTTEGHLTGTSIENSFTPEIKDTFDEMVLNNSVTVTAIYNHMPISYTVPIVVSKDVSGLDWVTDWDSSKVLIRDTEVLTPKLFAGTYNANTDSITGVAIGTDVLNDGQVQGITAWQDNEVTFLLGTDGSLLIGNPFDVDGSGLSYNDGRFVLNVDNMSIAGVTVPSWDDMEEQMDAQAHLIINTIQANIDSMNTTLDEVTNYVDSILQDEVVNELEKVQLDSLFEVVQQEVLGVQAQYDSVINNPYLPDEEVTNLERCYTNYIHAYNNIVDIYNDIFGEGTVEEIPYTTPEEEYLESEDFVMEEVAPVDTDEILGEETPVTYADTTDVNPVSLDTLVTRDGYVLVTLNGEVIQMITENTLLDFEDAVAVLREYSIILQQAISEALLSISENRAAMLVEEAKEEVRQEIADVDSALSDLETTMNGSFKSGLIGEQSKAILNERLMQLDIEKKDVDGQYEVLSQNSALDTLSKEKLSLAKTDLDAAHDVLVTKINQVIIDNLMTDSELQAVNDLISEYANELQNYSKVAQECNATIAVNTANLAVEAITDEDVFNKVTNYGVTQGLFIKDEKVYINSEYINTRNFKAVTDDGKETFKIDENGEVSITAKSLAITGSSNLATQDYVNTQIENLTNTNITFTLSNEFQIIPTDESYYPLSEGTYSIKITGYKGSSEEITDFTIGTVTSSDSAIVSVVSNINKTVVLSVSPDAPLGDSNGYVDIPITYDNRQFNKRWSWAVSKQGNQATYVTITGEQFFKYTNNYTGTPTPSQIVLTANVFNSTETGKWQYNDNGTWVDWKDGNGNTVTTKNLTIYPTDATLATTKSVFVRYYVDSVFDTYSVTCISDGSNGTNGKGISTIVNKYLATNSSSDVTTSTSGWTSVVQEISASKKYLWNYEIITYTDNSTTETTPCIIGTYGEDGETGVGISKITEYYLTSNSTNVSDVLLGDWSTSMKVPNKDAKYLWNYSEITYTDGIMSAQSPRIIGNFAEDGASGSDAYTVLLTNENHTFVANHLGATTEQIVYSDVIAYKGTTPITPTIGTLPTVTGLTLAKSGVRITIKSNTGTSLEDNGSFDIPITVDGQTFTKSFSWTKVKDGQDGETGASAKSVNIVASNMVFKSTDGGTVFTPDTIKLTAQYQNLTHSRWQYSIDGGTTWINVYNGDNGGWQGGITATSDSLTITIPKTCTFFTDTATSVVFKAISTDESFYDVITITKLYDVADVDFEGIAEDIAQDKVDELDSRLNQQAVFDRLTNNGTSQGIYLEDGQLYVNGEYIEANTIKVNQLEVESITMFVEDKVQTGIDNTNIGARNYLANTGTPFTMTGNNTTNQTSTMYHFVNKDNSPIIGGEATITFKYEITEGSTGSIRIQTNGVKSGDATTSNWFNIYRVDDITTIDNQGEVTYTRTYSENELNTFNGISLRLDNFVGSITIYECSMVVGNKSVGWTPAPEDTSDEIQDKVDNLNNSLNQNEIFSRLTNNGQSQGIFLENGELYVNGEFINSKNLSSVDNSGNQTFLIDENGNVHINANTFTLGGKGVTTTQDVLDLIDEYGQAENLLLVPNFNSGSLTGWSWSVSSYVFVDTTYKHDGNTACKLNYTGTSNAISLATTSMSIDKFESGKTYKVSMWMYVEDKSKLTNTMYLRANGIPSGSSSSVVIAERTIKADNLVDNQWTQLSFEFTCLQDHTTPRLLISVTGGISAWVTDFAIQIAGEGMSQEQIVDILNGAGQGLYIVDGQTLINAEYIQTGTLAADLIKVRVDENSNLLPYNYITMSNAINDDDFYITSTSEGYPVAECDLPIYSGGGDNDICFMPLGYSPVKIEKGKSYWFTFEYYALWGNDTKLDDGVGTSTISQSSKSSGTRLGNNLTVFLYDGASSNLGTGRNLLNYTDGSNVPRMFGTNNYETQGITITNSVESSYEYGYVMLTASGDTNLEHFYRFMSPSTLNLHGLEAGCTYTLSGLLSGTMSSIHIRHQYSSNGSTWTNMDGLEIPIESADDWQSFSFTFTIPSNATGYYLSFQDYNRVANKICYLAHLKLEKSSIPTPWSLSPVDLGYENPSTVEKSGAYFTLAEVLDFNESIKIEEREDYDGVYWRTWTKYVARIDSKYDYTGNLWIELDGSGFSVGDQGWFYINNLQLTDAADTTESPNFDYLTQLKQKYIELTDGSYYTNQLSVDGVHLTEGYISGLSTYELRNFKVDYDGFRLSANIGTEYSFVGESKSYYSYDGGSSGFITGFDSMYGVGAVKAIGGNNEGIFIGVHEGFQVPNSTEYGRADIYSYKKYDDTTAWDDWTDWELLGARVEPNALVRRNDNCSIATNGLVIQGDATNDDFSQGGTVYHGSIIFSEPLYTTTSNGQVINVHKDNKRIYFGNPNTDVQIEGSGVSIRYGTSDPSPVICKSNLHDSIYIGAQDSTETGRNIKDWGVHSYNLYSRSLTNGDGTSSAYSGYWSVLTFGNGTSGSAQLAIDWTSSGKGFYMRSLRDYESNWWNWKRIGNSDWILDSTSDERYKRAISDVSTEDCYNMVKNIELHSYLLLTEEERHLAEKGELDVDELFLKTITSEGIHHNLQMGVLAQDMLKYSCGTYVVNQDILRDENGELISDRYGIDAYNYASAILGGLQEEIKVRDEQYEELKKENENLKARLEKLEQIILKGE